MLCYIWSFGSGEPICRRRYSKSQPILISCLALTNLPIYKDIEIDCQSLQKGQYLCTKEIDVETQQPANCDPDLQVAPITCTAAPGLKCM